ncbi:hypothetical protein BIW11_13254 [Tropilaelaps mercedesae]|nr:hypothetical protein BIW11_13254 [Tropilaelaps mercedesae]
MDKQEGR